MSASRLWMNWLRRKRHSDPPPAVAAEKPDPPASPPDMEPAPESFEDPPAFAEMVDGPETGSQAEAVTALGWLERGEIAKARTAARDEGEAEDLLAFVAAIEAGERVLRPDDAGIADGAARGVMLAPAAGQKLLIVFGGDRGGFSVPRLLAEPGRPHVLFIEDSKGCLGFLGVHRLGPSYDSCLSRILGIARQLGATELFCLGAGPGMFSALRYGLDLGAAGVLGLGSLTRAGDLPPVKPARLGRKLLAHLAELGGDVGSAYAQATDRPTVLLCEPNLDMEVMPPAALPGLVDDRHRSQAPFSERHRLLQWADTTGHLEPMLSQLLASSPMTTRPVSSRRLKK